MPTFCEGASRESSFSLPSYSKSKRQGKLRRINSDALFYKDIYRNDDKKRYSYLVKRRSCSSLKLRDSTETDKTPSYSRSLKDAINCAEDVNTEKFANNIEDIISRGDLSQLRELGQCGFDFNTKDDNGNCALHYAALQGNEGMITDILKHGGSVWIRNATNQLPVELASNMNVRMLLSSVTLFYREQCSGQIESHLVSKAMSFEL